MKKSFRGLMIIALLVVTMILVAATPAFAGAKVPTVPQGASFELIQNNALTSPGFNVPGGQFYVYSPSTAYQWATLTRELNSVLFVYPNTPYQTKDAAWKAMVSNGLVTLAEKNAIYVVMPMPLNGSTWSPADLALYSGAQFWLFGGNSAPPFLDWTFMPIRSGDDKTYVMGEGDGASFVHNVLSKNANRIAGILTFGGTMTNFAKGLPVPAYLVHTDDTTVSYYKTVDGTDSEPSPGTFTNSAYPLKTVITSHIGGPLFVRFQPFTRFTAQVIADAWDKIFSRTSRINIDGAMMLTDSAWILNDRPNYDALGITRVDNLNKALPDGTVATWYDFVPKSAKQGNVPLVIALHGLNGDPIDAAESTGWVNKAAEKDFIVIAPAYSPANGMVDPVMGQKIILGVLDYAKATYHIDASRVYLAGFSMGGFSSAQFGLKNAAKFAAIGVMGFTGYTDADTVAAVDSVKATLDLPFMMLLGGNDPINVQMVGGHPAAVGFATNGLPLMDINELPHGTADYAAYPYWGFPTTHAAVQVSKGLHFDVSYMYKGDKALGKFVIFEEGAHTHEDFYATLAWDFFSQFSR